MDKNTFAEMALAEMGRIYRLARHLSSARDADDLVQETYFRAFRSMATYKITNQGMRPWLFKILHNVIYDRLSGDQRQRMAIERLRDEQQSSLTKESIDQTTAVLEVDWEQVDGRLTAAIESLPLHHKSIFLLSAIEGLRYREIADIADVPIGTVMSRLCRARAILASQLTTVAAEHGLTQRAVSGSSSDAPHRQDFSTSKDAPHL